MLYTYYKQYGNRIFFRYKEDSDDLITKNKVIKNYSPTLYTKTTEQSEVNSIYGYPLKPVNFSSIKEAKHFADQYKEVHDFVIEGNSNYANQFVIDLYEGQTPEYNEDIIRSGILDIEVWVTDDTFPEPFEVEYKINAITIYDSIEKRFNTFALPHSKKSEWVKENSVEEVKQLKINYFEFNSEYDLLVTFLSHMNDRQYDVTSGWNSSMFDMPYIVNRCFKVVGEKTSTKMLSPFNVIHVDDEKKKVEIVGQPHLDYLSVYKKHTFIPRASHKLDAIAHDELGEKKLSYEEYGNLKDLYENNFQLFIDYNIQDVNIIVRLDEKLGLLSLVYAMSYISLSNFEDTMGTVKIWEQLIAKHLFNKNQTPLFRHFAKESRDFEGAFVKEVAPGRYNWVISYDLKSLYPHIEMEWNIGPETRIDDFKQYALDTLESDSSNLNDYLVNRFDKEIEEKGLNDFINQTLSSELIELVKICNVSISPNFQFYSLDKKTFFSEIKEGLYNTRKIHKGNMIQHEKDIEEIKQEMKIRGLKI